MAEGKVGRLPGRAAELVRLQGEVRLARGTFARRAAQHATRTIPIVMARTSDAVARRFVAGLARRLEHGGATPPTPKPTAEASG
jgi:ABC-type uncharacterized transport system substrate-binding protein